jgi:hypothetical protein
MKHRFAFSSLLLLALFLALAPTALASSTWYVDGVNGNDNNDCKSPQTACKTIGHAISLASAGDSIMVAAATYTENLDITSNLKVIGAGAAITIIDGRDVNTVVRIPSNTHVTLSRLTISNGAASLGGGIYNSGTLTVNDSNVSRNFASSACRTHCTTEGGGIYNSGTLTINNSTISENSASAEGIYNTAEGGGIYNVGMLTINNCTFGGNSTKVPYRGDTSEGGGIYNVGMLTINNCTFSGNNSRSGGGIYNGGTLKVNNSTVSENSSISGGGILNKSGTATLQNTIVANQVQGGNCSGTMTSNGYNLSSDNTCKFNNTGDLSNTDPLLGPLQNNGGPTQTQALLSGSPAIDAGNPNGCTDGNGHLLKTDQRGAPRHDKEDTGGCDMGAFERQKD